MARVFRNSHVKTRVKNAVGSLFSAVSTQTFHWKKPQRRIQLVKNAGRKQQAFCLKPAADKLVSLLIFAFPTPAVKITKPFSSSLPFSFFFLMPLHIGISLFTWTGFHETPIRVISLKPACFRQRKVSRGATSCRPVTWRAFCSAWAFRCRPDVFLLRLVFLSLWNSFPPLDIDILILFCKRLGYFRIQADWLVLSPQILVVCEGSVPASIAYQGVSALQSTDWCGCKAHW